MYLARFGIVPRPCCVAHPQMSKRAIAKCHGSLLPIFRGSNSISILFNRIAELTDLQQGVAFGFEPVEFAHYTLGRVKPWRR